MVARNRKTNAPGLAVLLVLSVVMTACGPKFKLPPDDPGPKAPNPEALIRDLQAQGKQLGVIISTYLIETMRLSEKTKLSFSEPRIVDLDYGIRGKWQAWRYCMTVNNFADPDAKSTLVLYGFNYREGKILETLHGIPIFSYAKSCDSDTE